MERKSGLNPQISVIIPMYNDEKFIQTCMDSVLNQTFKNFEVIIVDDCSTDNSMEILQKYKDSRVKIYHRSRNLGESASRNVGLDLSSGKYVYFMDHDDAILENTLETFIIAAEESQAEAIYMNSFFVSSDPYFTYPGNIDATKYFTPDPKPRICTQSLIDRLQSEYIDFGLRCEPWLKFFRREFLQTNQIYFPPMYNAGDVMQNFAVLCLSKKILVIDACCYIYRVHPGSIMRTSADKYLLKKIESFSALIAYMSDILKRINLSRENQIILQAFALFSRIDRGFVSDSLSIEDVDNILSEVTKEAATMDPDVLRVLLHTLSLVASNANFRLKGEK